MITPLVTIVIPGKNSAYMLEACLKSISNQTYSNIETIVVDGYSSDNTADLAKQYDAKIYNYSPNVPKGTFDAPYKRNYGVKKAKGKYVYYVDADMELSPGVVAEAVKICETNTCDAMIVPEDSFGIGVWARAKNLERRCYWGDNTIEAPRFVRKSVWDELGGLDELLGGGGDDWDLYQKLLRAGHKVSRTTSITYHNEGHLSLKKLMRKRLMYGRDSLKYISKRPGAASLSYFPVRPSYIRNWKLFASRPTDTMFFVVMRACEYFAAFVGIVRSVILKDNV